MKTISLRIADGQVTGLDKLKVQHGISMNQLIRYAIAYLLEHKVQVARAYPFMEAKRKAEQEAEQ